MGEKQKPLEYVLVLMVKRAQLNYKNVIRHALSLWGVLEAWSGVPCNL